MVSIDLRLKLRHLFKKYRKIAFVVLIIWGSIFIINRYLGEYQLPQLPNTTYTPSVSVLDSSDNAPTQVQTTAEEMIDQYVKYCNEGNYHKAFLMLSEDCQKYEFNNDLEAFTQYVLVKMPTRRQHSIQNYSNYDDYYIYEVKYIDDILATGLTNQVYMYSTEKIIFKKVSGGKYEMAVGNFISYDDINSISENEYLKIDIQERMVRYSIETYTVKFTNRTDSTVVVSDNLQNNEVNLVLTGEYRARMNSDTRIVLGPEETKTVSLIFEKFADDGDKAQALLFGTIRVIEDYKGVDGTKEEQNIEIDNAIAKFSMQVPVVK